MEKPILVCIDFSKESILALKQAHVLRRVLKAPLHIIHVEESVERLLPISGRAKILKNVFLQEIRKKYLKNLKKHCSAQDIGKIKIVFGSPHERIIEEANKIKPRLIILGSHSYSTFKQLVIGSVAESLVQLSPCPIWIHRGKKKTIPKRILIAFSLTKFSEVGIKYGLKLAAELKAKPTLVFVSEPKYPPAKSFQSQKTFDEEIRKEEREALKEIDTKYKRQYRNLKTKLIQGNAIEKLVKLGSPAHTDLMVITTHGRRGIHLALMGSVTRQVIRHIKVSAVTVHPKKTNF